MSIISTNSNMDDDDLVLHPLDYHLPRHGSLRRRALAAVSIHLPIIDYIEYWSRILTILGILSCLAGVDLLISLTQGLELGMAGWVFLFVGIFCLYFAKHLWHRAEFRKKHFH
jgi:hypothetical protein